MWGPKSCLWLLVLMESLLMSVGDRDSSCKDLSPHTCRKIGNRQTHPLSKCYTKSDRCCATCNRLRLPNPGCPYGDRSPSCGSIGESSPISDCYSNNATCCETCPAHSRGTPGCEFGDKLNWCSEIGSRFLVSSCYREEDNCCDTCARFRSSMPGCEYGDHENWCSLITVEFCLTDPHVCCATCGVLMAATRAPSAAPNKTSLAGKENTKSSPDGVSNPTTSKNSVSDTYTGSPGRPNHNGGVASIKPTQSPNPVIHSTVSITISTTPTSAHTDLKNTPKHDLADICHNVTGHRIRHSKHGGRHRSRHRGQNIIDPRCISTTTTPAPSTSTTEPLWLLLSRGMPPQTTSTTTTTTTVAPITKVSPKTNVDKTSDVTVPDVTMTTLDAAMMGEMDYQEVREEDPLYLSKASHHHSAVCSLLTLLCISLTGVVR